MAGDFLTLDETAAELHVSTRHARRLADSGVLTKVARGLIDRDSVDRYLSSQRQGRTRAWAEHTAWGAIALLSGLDADWMGATQASRVRRTLRELSEPSDLLVRLRDRAEVRTFTAHHSAVPRLRALLAVPDLGRFGIVDARDSSIDGYIADLSVEAVVGELGLQDSGTGNVTLRVTAFDFDRVQTLVANGIVVAALDAATSIDPRIRGAGQRAVVDTLAEYA